MEDLMGGEEQQNTGGLTSAYRLVREPKEVAWRLAIMSNAYQTANPESAPPCSIFHGRSKNGV